VFGFAPKILGARGTSYRAIRRLRASDTWRFRHLDRWTLQADSILEYEDLENKLSESVNQAAMLAFAFHKPAALADFLPDKGFDVLSVLPMDLRKRMIFAETPNQKRLVIKDYAKKVDLAFEKFDKKKSSKNTEIVKAENKEVDKRIVVPPMIDAAERARLRK
jgi:hypothetical protein